MEYNMSYRKDAHDLLVTTGVVHADPSKINDPVAIYTAGRLMRTLKIDEATVGLIALEGQAKAIQFWNQAKDDVRDYKVGLILPLITRVSESTLQAETKSALIDILEL